MKEMITSDTTGKTYCPQDCVRIVNPRQIAAYWLHGVEILDIYGSRDFKTNEPILVAIFNKKDSREAYEQWCGYTLK